MDTTLMILGVVIVSLVTVQLGLVTLSSLFHAGRQRQQQDLNRHLMLERIEAAQFARQRSELSAAAWTGYRKFVVDRKVREANDICSFYLVPHDGKPLPQFEPGQYLTFQLHVPDKEKPVVRCYSLSDCPRPDYYRVTIKRVLPPRDNPDAPPGVSSSFFLDHVKESDILDVKAPSGRFVLDMSRQKPAVLIGGGVGITPFLTMLNAVAESGVDREIRLFYGVRNGDEHVMKEHLRQLTRTHHNVWVVVAYSRPNENDIEGFDYDFKGYVGIELLREHLFSNNYDFLMCGPPPMMQSMTKALEEWGVPKEDIHTEAFGPASIKAKKAAVPKEPQDVAVESKITVTFAKSGKKCAWKEDAPNILEFAAENGVAIDSACCAGSCGTCQVAVKSGDVAYYDDPEWATEDGCCLTCVGRPKTDLVIDA